MPYWAIARVTPVIRTYRAVTGVNDVLFVPSALLVTSATCVNVDPSVETLIRYRVAYDENQLIDTRLTLVAAPRSTCHHWLSTPNWLLHRVVVSLSSAF